MTTATEVFDPKQGDLEGIEGPGVSPISIPEINAAATMYAAIRDQRVALTAKEVEAKEKLKTLLHEHEAEIGRAPDGSIKYRFDDTLIELAPTKEKLKVTLLDENDEGE